MRKKKIPYFASLIMLVLIGVASWSVYNLINTGASDILAKFGIESVYIQNLTIVAFVFIVLLISGYGFKKSIERLLKG